MKTLALALILAATGSSYANAESSITCNNPFEGLKSLSISVNAGEAVVTETNTSGKEIYRQSITLSKDRNVNPVYPLSDWAGHSRTISYNKSSKNWIIESTEDGDTNFSWVDCK